MRRILLLVVLIAVLALDTPAEARRDARPHRVVPAVLETVVGNTLVLGYMATGLVGDARLRGVISSQRAREYMRVAGPIVARLSLELTELKGAVLGRSSQKLYAQMTAASDLLGYAVRALIASSSGKSPRAARQFVVYRASSWKRIQAVLGHPAASRRRRYRRGWRAAYGPLGRLAGGELALAYLVAGISADGYALRKFPGKAVAEYAAMAKRLVYASGNAYTALGKLRLPASSMGRAARLQLAASRLLTQVTLLHGLVSTRNRILIARLRAARIASWAALQGMKR